MMQKASVNTYRSNGCTVQRACSAAAFACTVALPLLQRLMILPLLVPRPIAMLLLLCMLRLLRMLRMLRLLR